MTKKEYQDCYLAVSGDPTYWVVENGERFPLHSQKEMHDLGLRPIQTVSQKELEAIPLLGSKAKAKAAKEKAARAKADKAKSGAEEAA